MNIKHAVYSPQFKSNIKIVSPEDFNKMTWKASCDDGMDEIFNYLLKDKYDSSDVKWKCYRTNAKNVLSEGVRSCIGGLVIDEKAKSAKLAMHVYDDENNFSRLSAFNPLLKGTNALLIGSRAQFEYSPKTFKYFEEKLNSNNVPISIFEDLQNSWEVDFAYVAKTNDILLCIKDIMNPKKYVKSMDELLKAFKRVVVSKKDTLEFINSKEKIPKLASFAKRV